MISETGKHLVAVVEDLRANAPVIVVRSPYEYQQIDQFVKHAKAKWAELDAQRKADKEAPLEQCRAIDAFYADVLHFCKDAENAGKKALLAYEEYQAREAAAAQKLADEQARQERERLEAASIDTMDTDPELSREFMALADSLVVPIVPAEIPVILGNSTRTVWKHKVEDATVLPREFMMPNEAMLAAIARSIDKRPPEIPGVKFNEVKIKSVKA